jgi:hypothetical protein
MPLRLSRFLVLLEALLLLLPVTLISLIFGTALIAPVFRGGGDVFMPFVTALSLFSLFFGWLLSFVFVFKPWQTFKQIGGFCLALSSFGMVIALMACVAAIYYPTTQLSALVLGSPATVTFVHLSAEWFLRRA